MCCCSSPLLVLAIFLLSLLGTRSANASNNKKLALFILETYRSSDGSRCETCERSPLLPNNESSSSCYLEDRTIFVASACYNRARNLAFIHDELTMKSSTSRIICRQRYETKNCDEYSSNQMIQFTAQSIDDCQPAWTLNECVRGERMVQLPEWCVESGEPVGEFIVPLLMLKRYDYREDCGSANYEEIIFYPDDTDANGGCSPLKFPLESNGSWTKGSGRAYCIGGRYSATLYEGSSNNNCDGNGTKSLFDGAAAQCPAEESSHNATVELFTHNCDKPKFFCKSMKAGSAVPHASMVALVAVFVVTVQFVTV